jgi:ketosteroid isomerase-like protein
MRIIFTAIAAGLAMAPAAASDKTDVMAPVHQFVDSFNKGDAAKVVAACAPQTAIVDEFPPHVWQGPGACSAWLKDYDLDSQKRVITDGFVKLGKPQHVDVSGDIAYIVVPANYTYREKGKKVTEAGSVLTLTMRKAATGWQITAWTWAKR